jgi:hypothetical protein
MSQTSFTGESSYLSSPSSSPQLSASAMPPGSNTVYSGKGVFNETYSVDPRGNVKQSGTFTFGNAFTSSNQIMAANGFSYDSSGDLAW